MHTYNSNSFKIFLLQEQSFIVVVLFQDSFQEVGVAVVVAVVLLSLLDLDAQVSQSFNHLMTTSMTCNKFYWHCKIYRDTWSN